MASGAGGIGGGGGGKIRTRRCHQGPIKPYQQGRQQHQVGDPDAAVCRRVGTWRRGALVPHVERTLGPEGRPGPGGGLSGRRGGDGKWAEPGPSLRRTRVVRAASARSWGPGASPDRRRAGTEIPGPRCAHFFRFWRGSGGVRLLLTSSRGRKGKMWLEARALAVC